jgi:hypothetical protein
MVLHAEAEELWTKWPAIPTSKILVQPGLSNAKRVGAIFRGGLAKDFFKDTVKVR